MLRLDSDIEERISALVDVLAKTKDSVATDGRIAASRAAAVAALRRTIALYMAEREQRRQHGWDVSRLDKRIDLRLEQMAKIAASEGPGEDAGAGTTMLADVEMEEAMGSLKAGKFVGSMVQTRKEMVTELQSTVDLLTSRRDTLTLQMEVTPDAVEKEKLAKEIAYAEGLADKRRAQVTEILAMPELEEATPGGVGKAFEIEKALRDARRVLRASLMDLQKRATTRDYQQTRADYLRKQLAETRAAMEAK